MDQSKSLTSKDSDRVTIIQAGGDVSCIPPEKRGFRNRSVRTKDELMLMYAKYYLEVAQDSSDPWTEIEKDKSNIQNAADWVAEKIEGGDRTKEIVGLAYDYAFALKGYIYRRAIQEGLRWLLAGVVACQELGEKGKEANLYNEIGLRYNSQGNYPEALKWYERSIGIKEQIGDQAGLATTYNNIASIHYAQGNYPEALKWYERSKDILEKIGDRHHLAMFLCNIGLLYRDTGKKDRAKQYLQQSHQLYLQLNLKSEAEEVKQLEFTL